MASRIRLERIKVEALQFQETVFPVGDNELKGFAASSYIRKSEATLFSPTPEKRAIHDMEIAQSLDDNIHNKKISIIQKGVFTPRKNTISNSLTPRQLLAKIDAIQTKIQPIEERTSPEFVGGIYTPIKLGGTPSPSCFDGRTTPLARSLASKTPGLEEISFLTARSNLLEALNLELTTQQIDKVDELIQFISIHKELWKESRENNTFPLENGLLAEYDFKSNSITITVEGHLVDFDSLFLTPLEDSKLSVEEFHADHLFIIKNQVRLVQEIKERKKISKGAMNHLEKATYITTKENIGSESAPYFLKSSLMFLSNNQVIMLLNKRCVTEKVGTGGYKVVSLAVDVKTGEKFASASIVLTGKDEKSTERKTRLAQKELFWGTHPVVTSHPDCLQIKSTVAYKSIKKDGSRGPINKIRILYKLLKGNDLFETLNSKPPLNPQEKLIIIKKLAEVTLHFHRNNIAMKDLKTENFFIEEKDGQLVVTALDFGLLQAFEEPTTLAGTLDYMAPEYRQLNPDRFTVIEQINPLSREERDRAISEIDKAKGDVWALGMIFSEVLGGTLKADFLAPIFRANENKKARISGLPTAPPTHPIKNLVWRMLQIDPDQRPSMESIVKELERY